MELHLASMENITAWALRKLCKGATDSYTGVMGVTNLIKRNNTWEEIDTYSTPGQRQWIQIATSKEAEITRFFERLNEEIKNHPEKDNIYGIQINCSCPSPNLIRIGQGPALIKRSTKVSNLVKEMLKQNKYKVGIKLRLGLNEIEVRQRKIFTLLAELEKIAAENPNLVNVTIHLKHAQEHSSTPYDYSLLNEIASFKLPFVINGGINSPEDIQRLLAGVSEENKKNIAGIMLGRQALKNPNVFLEIKRSLTGEKFPSRNFKELKAEFESLCKEHMPKAIYLTTIEERCAWTV